MNTEISSMLYGPMWAFIAVLSRIGPLLVMMPPLRGSSVPQQVRVMLAVMLAASVTPVVMGTAAPLPTSIVLIAIQLAKEILLGLLFGTTAMIVVTGLQISGQLISHLAGLEMAEGADPLTEESGSVISQLFSWLAMALFLIYGGHRQVFKCCLDSFQVYPAGAVLGDPNWLLQLHELVHHSLIIGLRAAAPMAIALLLSNLITALIGRTLPQLNILAVGFNVNAIILLTVLTISIGSIGWVFQAELADWLNETTNLLPSAVNHG